jgi:phenylacetate-CoA ligase
MGTILASGLQMMGVGPQDRVAHGFDFSIWIPGMMFQQGLQTSGVFCQAFGKVDPLEVYRRIPQHRLNVILGEPTWLIRLTEIAEKHGAYSLKLLIGGAEEMPADAIPWMERVWRGARVRMCYGSVARGSGLGFQPCEYRDGYHTDNVNYLTEIADPGADGYGEIVFSTLSRRVMPLIRYRTRDISRVIDEPCACGLTSPRLAKLRGRRDDLIVASGGNLYPLMFENILRDIPGLGRDWQVAFYLKHIREVMEIRVETERRDLDAIEKAVIHNAAHLYPDLIKNLNLGIFQLKVVAVAPQSLRHGRKLRRMVDMRHAAGSSLPEVNASAASPREELEVSV